MTKSIFFKICRDWFLGTGLVLGLLALTLWVRGEASYLVSVKTFFLPLQLSFFSHSTYRWWVKVLLMLALIPLVSLVLHLMTWSWEVSLTRSHLLMLCPISLLLAGLVHLRLLKMSQS